MLSACGDGNGTNVPEPTNLPPLTNEWTITMNHSGGIMGLSRSIEINSTGNYIVIEHRTNETFTGQLAQNDLDNLIQIVDSTTFSQNTKPYGCADCFVYDIQIMGTDGKFSAQVDDVTIGESGLEPLVTALRKIIEQELK